MISGPQYSGFWDIVRIFVRRELDQKRMPSWKGFWSYPAVRYSIIQDTMIVLRFALMYFVVDFGSCFFFACSSIWIRQSCLAYTVLGEVVAMTLESHPAKQKNGMSPQNSRSKWFGSNSVFKTHKCVFCFLSDARLAIALQCHNQGLSHFGRSLSCVTVMLASWGIFLSLGRTWGWNWWNIRFLEPPMRAGGDFLPRYSRAFAFHIRFLA